MRRLLLLACLLCCTASAVADPKLELVVQTGHPSLISSVSLSGDASLVLTGSGGTAILWDAKSGLQLRQFKGHTSSLSSVSISADGRRALTGSSDGSAITWDTRDGRQLASFTNRLKSIDKVSLSADGTCALVPSNDDSATIWNAESGKVLQVLKHTSWVHYVSLSGNGSVALTAGLGNDALLWNAKAGKQLHVLKGHTKYIHSVGLSADGKRAITGSLDNAAIIWDTSTGKPLHALKGHTAAVGSVSLNRDGTRALTATDTTAILWDATSGKQLRSFDKAGYRASLNADGSRVLIGSHAKATLFDAEGKQLTEFRGHTTGIRDVCVSEDGTRLLTGNEDSTAALWDLKAGEPLRTLKGNTSLVLSVALSRDGHLALTGAANESIVWDTTIGKALQTLKGHTKPGGRATLSVDGTLAMTASDDGTAILWDAKTGAKLHTLKGHTHMLTGTSLSNDNRLALTGSVDFKGVLWDVKTGKPVHTLKGHTGVGSMALGGGLALTGMTDKTAILWNAKTGAKLHTLQGNWRSNAACLSREGTIALLAGSDEASVWDTKSGKLLQSLKGHTDTIWGASLNADASRALTASADGTARIWDVKTGQLLCSLITLDGGKDWLVVTPDGYFDGSENSAKFIVYRIAGTLELVPLERYRKQFDRPGLLAMVWKNEDYKGKDAVAQELPPTVQITSPKAGYTSKDGKFTITAEAEGRGKLPVVAFQLMVNGKPHTKTQVENPMPSKAAVTWTVSLPPGRHEIGALAFTRAVVGVAEAVPVKYVGGQQAETKLPTLYVLAVGISNYPGKNDKLDFAHRDAAEIVKTYQTHSKDLFQKVEVYKNKALTDGDAKREAILEGLEWLRKQTTQKDYAVFFFAGHGVKDNRDKLYLMPVDGDRTRLTSTAIPDTIITEELVSVTGQLLVLLDACHSGNLLGKTRGMTEALLKDISSEDKGVAIICSATGRQLAQESREHKHGIFTLALIEALSGRGADEMKVRLTDGAVYFKQLDGYISDRVKQLSKGEQHPVTGTPRSFRDYPVSKPQRGG